MRNVVGENDPRIARRRGGGGSDVDPFRDISRALKKLELLPDIRDELRGLKKENEALRSEVDKIAGANAVLSSELSGVLQKQKSYESGHSRLERLIERAVTTASNESGRIWDVVKKLTSAITDRKEPPPPVIHVAPSTLPALPDIKIPELKAEVTVSRTEWDFNVQRDNRGLITKVLASPKGT